MRTIEQQRSVEIHAGFSPRPIVVAVPEMADSPSLQPETSSPDALLDGPVIQRAELKSQPAVDITVQNGIVSFGK